MLRLALLISCFAARLCVAAITTAQDSPSVIRARLLATPLESNVSVKLQNGQKWDGVLSELSETGIVLLAEPDKETRKRLKLGSGTKLKKTFSFDDLVVLEGPASAELVTKYLVLRADEQAPLQTLLSVAAGARFRLLAAAGAFIAILEKDENSAPFEYAVASLREKSEKDLDDRGALGFRVAPRTIGAWAGAPAAILERGPGEARATDYRILSTSRDETLEKELEAAVSQGFNLIGLTTPGERVVVLEARAPSEAAPEYRLVFDFDPEQLSAIAAEGYRIRSCSDGERLCVFEKSATSLGASYVLLSAASLGTLEAEMNEAGGRGYRLHRTSFGVQSRGVVVGERFAILEKDEAAQGFEYRIVSSYRVREIQKEIAAAASEGFEVVAITSARKSITGTGLIGAQVVSDNADDVFVVMERPIAK